MARKKKEMVYGYVPSVLDGTEKVLTAEDFGTSLPLPSVYSYRNMMSPVRNQGYASTCVPTSISAAYDYYYAMKNPDTIKDGKFVNTAFSINQVYNARTNAGEGMTYREAFEFCKNKGVVSEENYKKNKLEDSQKIFGYGRIPSLAIMKMSLVINGPCMIATYVKDPNRRDFWNGRGNYGGHATCIIGYDDLQEGLILRNSWGTAFADGGYTLLPYKEFNNILEAWAVMF